MKLSFLGKVRGKKFLTQIWVFRSFFTNCAPPPFLLVFSFQNMYRLFAEIRMELALNQSQKHLLPGFSRISSYSSIQPNQPNLGQIWVNIGQKGPFSNFPEKPKRQYFLDCRGKASCKKLGNYNTQFSKKAKISFFTPKTMIREKIGKSDARFQKKSNKRAVLGLSNYIICLKIKRLTQKI